ncbi:MAG: DUF2341 domain-containing protein [Proteobacteria bacterium]|nr:DUF2341 domain-containing protein [Pseudomonadota bacterium]
MTYRNILFLLLFLPVASFAQAYNDWQYAAPVTVDNSANADTYSDFQVQVSIDTATLVAAGKLKADGSDLRFSDLGLTTGLCYFIESGMNTATTLVWVNVPSLPSSGIVDISMVYGNPVAVAESNPDCVFDLFEDFSTDLGVFADAGCGSFTGAAVAGEGQLSWPSSGLMVTNTTFPVATAFLAEANVTGATGTWPGIYWVNSDASHKSYGIMVNTTNARISVTGGGDSYCSGHNWASTLSPFTSAVGLWSITWPQDGVQIAEFPTVGVITSTDITHSRTSDLQLMIGGISSGSGSIDLDWVRVRKFADSTPGTSIGAEVILSSPQLEAISIPVLSKISLLLLAGLILIPVARRLRA